MLRNDDVCFVLRDSIDDSHRRRERGFRPSDRSKYAGVKMSMDDH